MLPGYFVDAPHEGNKTMVATSKLAMHPIGVYAGSKSHQQFPPREQLLTKYTQPLSANHSHGVWFIAGDVIGMKLPSRTILGTAMYDGAKNPTQVHRS